MTPRYTQVETERGVCYLFHLGTTVYDGPCYLVGGDAEQMQNEGVEI